MFDIHMIQYTRIQYFRQTTVMRELSHFCRHDRKKRWRKGESERERKGGGGEEGDHKKNCRIIFRRQ